MGKFNVTANSDQNVRLVPIADIARADAGACNLETIVDASADEVDFQIGGIVQLGPAGPPNG